LARVPCSCRAAASSYGADPAKVAQPSRPDRIDDTSEPFRVLAGRAATPVPSPQLCLTDRFDVFRTSGIAHGCRGGHSGRSCFLHRELLAERCQDPNRGALQPSRTTTCAHHPYPAMHCPNADGRSAARSPPSRAVGSARAGAGPSQRRSDQRTTGRGPAGGTEHYREHLIGRFSQAHTMRHQLRPPGTIRLPLVARTEDSS
jgi:hypothetical protein